MSWIEIIADRKIRDAQEEGQFQSLEGQGRPLRLDVDSTTPVEQRIAQRLLRDGGFVPDWIQLEKDIREAREALEQRIQTFAARRARDLREGPSVADARRDAFLIRVAEQVKALNAAIARFNLVVPIVGRQQGRVDAGGTVRSLAERFARFGKDSGTDEWLALLREEARPPTRLGNRVPRRRRREIG